MQIPKKTTIGKYLELVKQQLVSEFAELRGVSSENLLYVKEDLIIPHVRETVAPKHYEHPNASYLCCNRTTRSTTSSSQRRVARVDRFSTLTSTTTCA